MSKHKLFNFNNYVEEECGMAQIIIQMQLKSPPLVLASSKMLSAAAAYGVSA